MADVVHVDFKRPVSPLERVRADLDRLMEETADLERRIGADRKAVEWQREHWRKLAYRLARELRSERCRSFPFTDDAVLEALRRFDGAPVSASRVARALHPQATHSTAVRVGLALSRLRAAGKARVEEPPTRRRAARWAPAEADDAR